MPIETGDFLIFLVTALTLNLTPGNDMMFVLGQSLKGGLKAGIAASLGIATGSLVHLLLVALGLAAVLAKHPLLFDGVRYAGAAYLAWLAIGTLRKGTIGPVPDSVERAPFAAWRDGTLVNMLNPKVILFFFAFLPPFVEPDRGSPLIQLMFLGLVFNIGGTLINFGVALFAVASVRWISSNVKIAKGFALFSAAVFLVLALRIVFDAPRFEPQG